MGRDKNSSGNAIPELTEEEDTMARYRIGARLIAAGFLNQIQRNKVLARQNALNAEGEHLRFGELAMRMGFCTAEQVESLPGYLGDKLVSAGLITPAQRRLLITWQGRLRKKGIVIRFGDLTISEGFCTAAEIEAVISIDPRACCGT